MMFLSEIPGNPPTFGCTICHKDPHPCLRCSQQKSVYNLGYQDGSLNNPFETTGFQHQEVVIYKTGYTAGQESKNG